MLKMVKKKNWIGQNKEYGQNKLHFYSKVNQYEIVSTFKISLFGHENKDRRKNKYNSND